MERTKFGIGTETLKLLSTWPQSLCRDLRYITLVAVGDWPLD